MKIFNCLIVLFFYFLFFAGILTGQDVDSLKKELAEASADSSRIQLMYSISDEYFQHEIDSSIIYAGMALKLAQKTKNKEDIASTSAFLAYLYQSIYYYSKAIEYYDLSMKTYSSLKDTFSVAELMNNIAMVYQNQGDFNKAADYYFKSLKTFEKTKSKIHVISSLTGIGSVYEDQEQFAKARDFYKKALNCAHQIEDEKLQAESIGNIANTYNYQGNYQTALKYYNDALIISETTGDKTGKAYRLANIGYMYQNMGQFAPALESFKKALEIYSEMDDKTGIAHVYENTGLTYLTMAKKKISIEDSFYPESKPAKYLAEAEKYLLDALAIFENLGEINPLIETYSHLSDLYYEKGQYREALNHYRRHTELKDSLLKIETKMKIANLEAIRQNDKKDHEILLLQKKSELRMIIIIATVAGIILVGILASVIYRRYRYKSIAENMLKEKNYEIGMAHKRLTDSIEYGKTIQTAVLPYDSRVSKFFEDYFVLFLPRDIVSGDFYWIEKIDNEIIIAVGDCTGHGVPGAFMAMIGNELLNTIIIKQKVRKPSDVLEQMHKEIRYALKQDETKSSSHDGMDICLCIINTDTNDLQFAGARRPLYYVSNGELKQIKGDRKSIGGRQKEKIRKFTNHEIVINKGSLLYLTTDGYQDQQSPDDESFGVGKFRELLLSISCKEMQEQKKILIKEHDDHAAGEKNTDDIAILGIKY